MKVILKTKSDKTIQDILIEEFPFTIGRDKSPFAEMRERSAEMKIAVSFLSRNHAVISSEQGAVYLADLGSVNGTLLNGSAVTKEPVRVCNGDSVLIGDMLEYTFFIEEEQIEEEQDDDSDKTVCASGSPMISLTLIPEDAGSGLDHIVIRDFPFLISRTEGYFYQYNKSLPEQLKKLSRKHAQITCRDNKLYVEDFGSSNGTLLSGKKVENQPMPLCKGDHIAFGEFFRYILNSDQLGAASAENEIVPDDRTVCDRTVIDRVSGNAEKSKPKGAEPTVSESGAETGTDKDADDVRNEETASPNDLKNDDMLSKGGTVFFKNSPTLFAKIVLEQNEQKDNSPDAPKKTITATKSFNKKLIKGVLSGLGILLFIAASVWTISEISPEYRLKKMTADGKYEACIAHANEILSQDSKEKTFLSYIMEAVTDRDKISEIANDALIKGMVPAWTDTLNKGDFIEARKFLADATEQSKYNPYAQKAVRLLNWITDMREYFFGKNLETPIVIFHDEIRIASLLEKWDMNKNENLFLLNQITKQDSNFESLQKQISGDLTVLEKWKFDYLPPLEEFKKDIQDHLNAGRLTELSAVISKFKREFPGVGGIKDIEEDLSKYDLLLKANPSERGNLLKDFQFKSKPFIEKAESLRQ